ncbi:MAG: hypothetical protein ACRD44_04090, partial [Bryobacteraceae bacterium]
MRVILGVCFTLAMAAAPRPQRYALILADPPAAQAVKDPRTAAAADHLSRIQAAQATLRSALADRRIAVTGATNTLLNAIYVSAPAGRVEELRNLPGVIRVEPMEPLRRHMVRANDLVRAPEAWNTLGGAGNAGSSVRIGILDTGIDQQHAAFQDAALNTPAGFPKCRQQDCAFTNNKVIVARSYVDMLV